MLVRRYVAWYESHPRSAPPPWRASRPPTTAGAIHPFGLTLAELSDDQEMSVLRQMVWIDGGKFHMGDERFYQEERPVRPGRRRRLLD